MTDEDLRKEFGMDCLFGMPGVANVAGVLKQVGDKFVRPSVQNAYLAWCRGRASFKLHQERHGIVYSKGKPDPSLTGVFACRIVDPQNPHLQLDVFLMWYEAKWWYLGSDQQCRTDVKGWIGPLLRRPAQ